MEWYTGLKGSGKGQINHTFHLAHLYKRAMNNNRKQGLMHVRAAR